MLSERLRVALDTGALVLPDTGAIAVVEPHPDDTLSSLPTDRVTVISRMAPTHNAFTGVALATDFGESRFALTIVALPRARAAAQHIIAQAAAATDGPIVIDGQKTDGIASILKALKSKATLGTPIAKAHGKLCVIHDADVRDWFAPTQMADRFVTAPGAFSSDAIDPGSAALAAALPASLKGHVVDLGAGWGYLSDAILMREGVERLDLVEADHAALSAAKQNINDDRTQFHWADARTFKTRTPADHVVTNPPFHSGRRADPALGKAFIATASRLLAPRGQLWLVANRHLPYEQSLDAHFKDVRTLQGTPSFKLFHATGPRTLHKG